MQQTTVGGGLAFKKRLKRRKVDGLTRPPLNPDALALFSSVFSKLDTQQPLYYHVYQEREKENEQGNEREKEKETEEEEKHVKDYEKGEEEELGKQRQEEVEEHFEKCEEEEEEKEEEEEEIKDIKEKSETTTTTESMTVNIIINNTNNTNNTNNNINNNSHNTETNNYNNGYGEVWSRDVGMMIWERSWGRLQLWVETVAFDVHAALSEQENLRQLHLEPFQPTPLAFYLYTGMCNGAWIMGDKELEDECCMRARQMAGQLFDEPDYNTAAALLFLGSHALFAKADRQTASYYNLLAETMCENLQYTNSEVYIRALTYSHLIHPTMRGVMRFQEKVKTVQQGPYHFVMTSPLLDNARVGDMSELLGDVSRIASYNRKQLQLQRLLYMLLIVCSLTRCPEYIDPMLLRALGKRVKKLYSEWVQPGSQEGLKPSSVYGTSLLFTAMLVELYTRLGEHTKALNWAALYLTYAQHVYFSKLPPLCSTAVAVLQSFSRSEATSSQLHLLLGILRKLQPRYQILTPILQPYEHLCLPPSSSESS